MPKEVRLEVAERLTKGSNKDAAFAGLCFLTSTAGAERALTATRSSAATTSQRRMKRWVKR